MTVVSSRDAPTSGSSRPAAELTAESGWATITMAKLADRVGVSRQTVYNEIGSKPALAEAMVLRELALFLAEVDRAFDAHPDDLVAAIRGACRGVLELAQDNRLLKAVVSATHGADTELLPAADHPRRVAARDGQGGRARSGGGVRRRRCRPSASRPPST